MRLLLCRLQCNAAGIPNVPATTSDGSRFAVLDRTNAAMNGVFAVWRKGADRSIFRIFKISPVTSMTAYYEIICNATMAAWIVSMVGVEPWLLGVRTPQQAFTSERGTFDGWCRFKATIDGVPFFGTKAEIEARAAKSNPPGTIVYQSYWVSRVPAGLDPDILFS